MLFTVTAANAVRDVIPLRDIRGLSVAVTSTQLLLIIASCYAATGGAHFQAPALLWSFLWIFSTLRPAVRNGRLIQLGGLIAIGAVNPIVRATFAAITALLAMNPRLLRRATPQTLCLLVTILLIADPSPKDLPPLLAVSGGLAAILAFADVPILGFALLNLLLPGPIPEPWIGAFLLLAVFYLLRPEPPRLDIALPLLMFVFLLHARLWQDVTGAADFHHAMLLALFMLPFMTQDNQHWGRFLALPIPPLPLFLALVYLEDGVISTLTHAPQGAWFLILPMVLAGTGIALLLLKAGRPPAWNALSAPGPMSSCPASTCIACLLVAIFPGFLLSKLGSLTADAPIATQSGPPSESFFSINIGGHSLWWTPIAGILLGIATLLLLAHRRPSYDNDGAPVRTLNFPEYRIGSAHQLLAAFRGAWLRHPVSCFPEKYSSGSIHAIMGDIQRFGRAFIVGLIIILTAIGFWSMSSWN